MSIRFKPTYLVPTIGYTPLFLLPRRLYFRLLLLLPASIRRRPPRLYETVLARRENDTLLFRPSIRLNTCTHLENDYLIVDMHRADNLLSVRARKPDRLSAIE